MNIGLYNLKYPARKLIASLLPALKNTSPNTLSALMLPTGLLIALCCYFSSSHPALFLPGVILTVARMFLGTMDGLVAVHFKKESATGELFNRLAPEFADVMYLSALALAAPAWFLPGVLALGAAWLTSFAGLIGLLVKRPLQSVGPVGQTDRLAAFILFALLQFIAGRLHWPVDFIQIFLWWSAAGGFATVFLRLSRTFNV